MAHPLTAGEDAAQRTRELSDSRKLVSLPIGVNGADLSLLSEFSSKPAVALDGLSSGVLPVALRLDGARSASTSSDASVQLPSIDSWGTF